MMRTQKKYTSNKAYLIYKFKNEDREDYFTFDYVNRRRSTISPMGQPIKDENTRIITDTQLPFEEQMIVRIGEEDMKIRTADKKPLNEIGNRRRQSPRYEYTIELT